MRATLLFLLTLLSGQILALHPKQKAPLIQHLLEVNERWSYVELSNPEYFEEISFPDDRARIAKHLERVGELLQNRKPFPLNAQQSENREALLSILKNYERRGQFPINTYHLDRQPYFIDNEGTACAVGHLLQKSGYQGFAKQISQEMNYAYLLDMPYKEIETWSWEHGFSKEELALIQPGYQPSVSWESVGAGTNGEITALYGDEVNQRLIVAGNFTELGDLSCQQIGSYANGVFTALGNGVAGKIEDIEIFEGNIYLGGLFSDSSNIAFWDGQTWNYERLGKGSVFDLEVVEGYLLAVGNFLNDPSQNRQTEYVARKEEGVWAQWGRLDGPAYCIAQHQGEVFLGGDFRFRDVPSFVRKQRKPDNNWIAATHDLERLNAPVLSLVSDGTHLYAAGDCEWGASSTPFCFARLGNSGWERLIDSSALEGRSRISKLFLHEGRILVVGDYEVFPLVGTFGGGISKFRYFQGFTMLEPLADLDSAVHAVASVNGELFIGGAFLSQNPFQPDTLSFLAKTPNLTSIEPEKLFTLGIQPNPMRERSLIRLESLSPIQRLEAFDLSGRKIELAYEIQANVIHLKRNNLPSGLLMLKVWGET
ncbi:MAG: T9SS type A sorting domain-containing protein, partial [Bacteroidota bacterium]